MLWQVFVTVINPACSFQQSETQIRLWFFTHCEIGGRCLSFPPNLTLLIYESRDGATVDAKRLWGGHRAPAEHPLKSIPYNPLSHTRLPSRIYLIADTVPGLVRPGQLGN